MNILFLTISKITDINVRGIYTDLMRKFRDEGHNVFIVSPAERRYGAPSRLIEANGIKILKVKTLNLQKTNIIEKGIGTILLQFQYLKAIQKFLDNEKFDLVLYTTPPITFTKVIKRLKDRDDAQTYLLLKDIFPQNAVDLGAIRNGGLLHRYFIRKEKALYAVSDHIGCMSPANVSYILSHNPQLNPAIVEVCPNSIELQGLSIDEEKKKDIRSKYGIAHSDKVFIYGGNLGKPQGLDFLTKVIEANQSLKHCFFLIVGTGTEYNRIKSWFELKKPANALLLPGLPKAEYDMLLQASDVGLIFLDKRFTIPNFPSRLLPYLEFKMPVIAATDASTDIGRIAEENGFGFSVLSGDLKKMNQHINNLVESQELMETMGRRGYEFLLNNYTVEQSYPIILKHLSGKLSEAYVAAKRSDNNNDQILISEDQLKKKGESHKLPIPHHQFSGTAVDKQSDNFRTSGKKIAILNQNSGYLMIDLANAYHKAGYEVTLVTGRLIERDKPLADGIKVLKIIPYNRSTTVKRLITWNLGTLQMLLLLWMKLRKHKLIIVSNPPFAPLLPLLVNNYFHLLIYDIYPNALYEMRVFANKSFVIKMWEKANKKVFAKADRIITISGGMQSVLQRYAGEKEVEVIPVWTDNTFLKPIPKEENTFITAHALQGKFVVMYSGNLGLSHDVGIIPELAMHINDPNIYFLIIGEGEKKRYLEQKIKDYSLTNIKLLPFQPASEIPKTLSSADIAIVTLGKNASKLSVPSKTFNLMSVGAIILSIAHPDSELARLTERFNFGKSFKKTQLKKIINFIKETAYDEDKYREYKMNSLNASKEFDKEINCQRFISK